MTCLTFFVHHLDGLGKIQSRGLCYATMRLHEIALAESAILYSASVQACVSVIA